MRLLSKFQLAAALATCASCSVALPACSSSDPSAPVGDAGVADVAAPVDAGADAETKLEAGPDAGSAIAWRACANKAFDCATVPVPLDYDDPTLGKVSLAIARSRARGADRIGVLFTNPGGPGAPVVSLLTSGSLPQIAADTNVLFDRFDVIAMDPRGIGQSAPINCFTPAIEQALLAMPSLPKADPEWATLFAATGQVGPSCQAKADPKLVARMDTASVARDMDTIRGLLGEETINYLGFSYGTHIGATYATLFPKRVRAFALDSPVFVTSDRRDRWRSIAASYDDALDQFFAWCATSPKCTFGPATGRTQATIAQAYDGLVTALDTTPLTTPARLDGSGVRLATTGWLYAPLAQWKLLAAGLASAASGDGTALRTQAVGLSAPADPASENLYSAFLAIGNIEEPLPAGFTQSNLRSFIEVDLKALAPRLGPSAGANELPYFLGWSIPIAHPPPTIDTKSAPPLLITATRHDPVTPYAGALKLQTALANGSHLVTYEGSGHTQTQFSPCLAAATAAFLTDPTKAPKSTSCPAITP